MEGRGGLVRAVGGEVFGAPRAFGQHPRPIHDPFPPPTPRTDGPNVDARHLFLLFSLFHPYLGCCKMRRDAPNKSGRGGVVPERTPLSLRRLQRTCQRLSHTRWWIESGGSVLGSGDVSFSVARPKTHSRPVFPLCAPLSHRSPSLHPPPWAPPRLAPTARRRRTRPRYGERRRGAAAIAQSKGRVAPVFYSACLVGSFPPSSGSPFSADDAVTASLLHMRGRDSAVGRSDGRRRAPKTKRSRAWRRAPWKKESHAPAHADVGLGCLGCGVRLCCCRLAGGVGGRESGGGVVPFGRHLSSSTPPPAAPCAPKAQSVRLIVI